MGIFLVLALALTVSLSPSAVAHDRATHGFAPTLIAARPTNPEAQAIKYNNKGVDLFNAGKYEECVQQYNEAIRLNPRYTEAYSNRGAAFDALNNPERAVQDYTAAINLDPKLTPAFSNRAAAYGDLGNFHDALADWNIVIQRSPRDAFAYNGRGVCYKALGDLQKAFADFDRAAKLKPGYAKAIKNRDAVKRSLAADPTAGAPEQSMANPQGQAPGAQPPQQHGNPGGQQVAAATAPQIIPSSESAQSTAAQTATVPTGTQEPPVQRAHAPMFISPFAVCSNAFHQVLGSFYTMFGQQQSAATQYSLAIEANPNDAFAYFRRGNAYARSGDVQHAIADYNAAVQVSPRLHQADQRRVRLMQTMANSPQGSPTQLVPIVSPPSNGGSR